MKKIFISTTIIFFFLSGCVYVPYHAHIHRVPDEKTLASIKEGLTSKEEVLLILGEPDRVRANEKIFLYWWQEEEGMVVWLVGDARQVRSTYSLHIEFDENNIVKKFEMKKKGIFSLSQALPDEFFEW